MSKRQLLLIHFLLFTVLGQLPAQEYIVNVQQYGIEDGLAHRNIFDSVKDSYGFLWLVTNKGVQRFDGYNFKSYPILDKEGNTMQFIRVGQKKNEWLWLLSKHTIVFLHPITGEIQYLEAYLGKKTADTIEKIIPSTHNENVYYSEHQQNRLYFTKRNEVIIIDFEKGIKRLNTPLLPKRSAINLVDHKENIWVLNGMHGNYNLIKLSPTGKILATYKEHFPNAKYRHFSIIKSTVFEWKAHIYFFVFAPSTLQHEFYTLNNASNKKEILFTLAQGIEPVSFSNGLLWCLSSRGWKVYDISGKLAFELNREDYDDKLFEDLNQKKMITDNNNHYYLSSQFGLNIIDVRKNPFHQYFSDERQTLLSVNNSARGIIVTKDSVIVNFEFGGLVRFPKGRPEGRSKKEAEKYSIINAPKTITDKAKNNYSGRPIFKTAKGNFWTGHEHYLRYWNSDFSKTTQIDLPKVQRTIGEANWSIWENEKGCIYAPFLKGLLRYCPSISSYSFEKYKEIGADFGNMRTYQLRQEGQSILWMCTDKGLIAFDLKENKVSHRYFKKGKGPYKLPCDLVHFLHIDEVGNKWLGTNEGLLFWNTQTGEKRLFNRNDGLSNEVIYAVFEDDQNRLWLSSDYGIMSFNKETFKVHTYLPEDGVAQEEFNRISHFQEEDGTIYFGGLNGVTTFHPDDFSLADDNYAKLLIAEYEIFDGTQGQLLNKISDLVNTNTITFQPNDKYFKLQFVLPTFADISKNLYAWKIDGIYDDWTYQKENSLQLAALPYGKYILHIKAQGAKGGWSPHELKINMVITKPFYLKIWFFILCFLLLILGIVGYNRYRMQRFNTRQRQLQKVVHSATAKINTDKKTIEKQAEELLQLDKMKSRFFANVSHELRTPLTLILGPINAAIKSGTLNNRNFTHLVKAKQSGKDLLKLVASILDLSKMESGKLSVYEKPILLFNLLRRISSIFESHAQRSGIQLSFDYQTEKTLQLQLDEEKIETILNNLLSNAIKFTPSGGKIVVKTEDKGNVILLSVNDTGRGIHADDLPKVFDRFYQTKQKNAPTEGGTGIGLALCQELVKIMGGKIWAESTIGKGSTFFVQINRIEILGVAKNETSLTKSLPIVIETKGEIPPTKESLATTNAKKIEVIAENEVQQNNIIVKKEHHLLIVEDNHELRDYIKSILSPYYTITAAENGQNALACLNENEHFQLIVSDIMMPVMDGFQLLKKLKESDRHRHIPVIMLTARADMQDKLKALRIGVDDYLLKPFDEEELLARIENLLQNYQERIAQLPSTTSITKTTVATLPIISIEDEEWLKNAEKQFTENLSNAQYAIPQLAHDMAISERQLRRRIKQLTGLSPLPYIKEIRLQKARHLLEQKQYKTIAQTAAAVGFQHTLTFSRNFSQRFGRTPSDYLNN